MPDGACKEIDIRSESGVARYGRNGFAEVDNPMHERALREAGCFPATGSKPLAAGWRCQDCGFHGWFRTCKCGSQNTVKEV